MNRDKQIIERQKILLNQIIEDYKRRFNTIKKEIDKGGNDITLTRIGTKLRDYQYFVIELERIHTLYFLLSIST